MAIKFKIGFSHGTIQKYEEGCRCYLCILTNSKYQRDAYPCNKQTIKIGKNSNGNKTT